MLSAHLATPDEVEKVKKQLNEERQRRKAQEEMFETKLQLLTTMRPKETAEDVIEKLYQLDQYVERQVKAVESADPTTLDVETMKLKRLIDRRVETYATLRRIVDRYNETARGILDSVGR